ncbi:MAG TPA: hypothetical protein VE971_05760 [Candidatus Eisenbacteria bacterium]|nr:hypothetical protein [Candidatus Eisenbacteria bacterium]
MNTNTGISLGTVAIAVIAVLFVSGAILTNQQALARGGGGAGGGGAGGGGGAHGGHGDHGGYGGGGGCYYRYHHHRYTC